MVISEFQLALIGVGVVAIAGVWGYNSWQEYRYRKAAENIFRSDQQDALLDESDVGNDYDAAESEAGALPNANEVKAMRIEPVFTIPGDEASVVEVTGFVSSAASVPVAEADSPCIELVDTEIELGIALPPTASVADVKSGWAQLSKVEFGKPVRWVGRNRIDAHWCNVVEGNADNCDHAMVTIQLADRQGAISSDELALFCQTTQAVAESQGGSADFPPFDDVIRRAQSLDEHCAAVDIQIAIHIVGRSGQAFIGSKLRGMLEAAGLQLAPDGLFYLLDTAGGRLLSVCNSGAVPFSPEQMRTGTIPDVTFWLDVPRVTDGGRVFDTMLATARQLAEALDGVLVDDQRNPLADSVLSGIRAKVVELQAQMTLHGIPAGGRRALRLFA